MLWCAVSRRRLPYGRQLDSHELPQTPRGADQHARARRWVAPFLCSRQHNRQHARDRRMPAGSCQAPCLTVLAPNIPC